MICLFANLPVGLKKLEELEKRPNLGENKDKSIWFNVNNYQTVLYMFGII